MSHDPTQCPTAEELLAAYPAFATEPFATGSNVWTLTVIAQSPAGGSGLYLTNVEVEAFPFMATPADSLTQIRDGISLLMDASEDPDWIHSSGAVDDIVISGTEIGRRLNVTSNFGPTGAEMTMVETRPLTPAQPIHDAITAAACIVCEGKWGCSQWEACMAVAVHFLKMWNLGQDTDPGPTGQTTAMGQGPFSQSWAVSTATTAEQAWWMATAEGQKYLSLRRLQGPQFVLMRAGGSCRGYQSGQRAF